MSAPDRWVLDDHKKLSQNSRDGRQRIYTLNLYSQEFKVHKLLLVNLLNPGLYGVFYIIHVRLTAGLLKAEVQFTQHLFAGLAG